ncbi:MAG: hypothetical protein ACREKJ_13920 [Candidatus Rokuibacteriota bacterium]
MVTWVILFASLIVVPIQLAAALQLLGMIARIPLAAPAAVAGAMLVLLLVRGRGSHTGPASMAGPGRLDSTTGRRAVIQAAVIVGSTYGIVALERVTGFPSSWDGVAYHLPLAVRWLQEGSLALPATGDWRESLPGNAEIVAMLALGTGWQALAEMWNVVSALGLCAGSYLLARGMGVGASGALAGAVLVASVPLVLFQTFSAYVDLFGSACLIGSLGLFVVSRPPATASLAGSRALILSGLGCGLAVGTKPTLWPYAALVAVGVTGSLVWSRAASRPRPRLVLIFLVATAAPCLFWFARSFAATGNPFYPLALDVPGLPSLSGFRPSEITDPNYHLNFVRSRAEWLLYPWIEFKRHGYSFGTGSGLGPVFAAFVPVGLLYTLWSVRRSDPGPARAVRLACSAGLALGTAVWWIAVQGTPRFALPLIVLACVLATPFLDAALRRRPRGTGALLVGAAIVSALLSMLPTAQELPRRVRHHLWERYRFYDVPPLIDRLPSCSIVINYNPMDEFWNSFALAGNRAANTVVPPWAAKQALDRSPGPGCPIYLFDRDPFMSAEEASRVESKGYVRVDLPLEARWRVWRRTAR